MSKGKIGAQIGHIVQVIIEELIRNAYENPCLSEEYKMYMKWKRNDKMIILKATEEQLNELLKISIARKYIDYDKLTVVGFLPNNTIHEIAKDYKLL